MGIYIDIEKVKKELLSSNELILSGLIKLEKVISSREIIVSDEFGQLKTTLGRLNTKIRPSITSAIDINQYFANKANHYHKNRYDYSEVNYLSTHSKIKIICKEHGEFFQTPHSHLQGRNCPSCSTEFAGKTHLNTTESFITQANVIHKNKYNYDSTIYTKSNKKVKIICKEHGEFTQQASVHLRGFGCKKCSRLLKTNNSWSFSNWENKGKASKKFVGFQLYILKCYDNTEVFYKVGKTFNDIKTRYSSKIKLPYEYTIEKVITGTSKEISLLEQNLKTMNKKNKYLPTKKFGGRFECFNKIDYDW